jgi:hypothetical protein
LSYEEDLAQAEEEDRRYFAWKQEDDALNRPVTNEELEQILADSKSRAQSRAATPKPETPKPETKPATPDEPVDWQARVTDAEIVWEDAKAELSGLRPDSAKARRAKQVADEALKDLALVKTEAQQAVMAEANELLFARQQEKFLENATKRADNLLQGKRQDIERLVKRPGHLDPLTVHGMMENLNKERERLIPQLVAQAKREHERMVAEATSSEWTPDSSHIPEKEMYSRQEFEQIMKVDPERGQSIMDRNAVDFGNRFSPTDIPERVTTYGAGPQRRAGTS